MCAGFRYVEEPCFISGVKPLCKKREEYLHFDDKSHVTQRAHRLLADDCFNGTMTCTPYNMVALAQVSSKM